MNIPGYVGNGMVCRLEQEPDDCKMIANQCSPYGECVENLQTQDFECRCLPGFKGNGMQCEPIGKMEMPLKN